MVSTFSLRSATDDHVARLAWTGIEDSVGRFALRRWPLEARSGRRRVALLRRAVRLVDEPPVQRVGAPVERVVSLLHGEAALAVAEREQ